MFIELNFRQKKWLLCCTYNPNRNNISNHLDLLRRSLDLYYAECEHFIIFMLFSVSMMETGLSDFHNMTVTVMKTTFEKLNPNIIHYRDYRKFSNDKFRENLISSLSTENIRVECNDMENALQ